MILNSGIRYSLKGVIFMNQNKAIVELVCPSCLHETSATRYEIKTVEQLGPVLCPHCGRKGLKRFRNGMTEELKKKAVLSGNSISHLFGTDENAVYVRVIDGVPSLCKS